MISETEARKKLREEISSLMIDEIKVHIIELPLDKVEKLVYFKQVL